MTSVLYVGQYFIERRFGRGFSRSEQRRDASVLLGFGYRPRVTVQMTEPMVKAEGVHKRFGRLEVLKGIYARGQPRRGDVHARAVGLGQVDVPALHQPPREDQRRAGCRSTASWSATGSRDGKLHELHEREIARKRAEIGMVFQHFNLFPHMTALENVMLAPVQVAKVVRGKARAARVGPARSRRSRRQGRHLPGGAVGRPAAAGGDRAGAGHAAQADAVRRADLGARPRAGRRRARRDAPAGRTTG